MTGCMPTKDRGKSKQVCMIIAKCVMICLATRLKSPELTLQSHLALLKEAEVAVIARDSGRAIFKWPRPVPARAATSQTYHAPYDEQLSMRGD
eukprot:6188117-Pleurochrysis_carterae.AAC.1